jgi:hypothetical protein
VFVFGAVFIKAKPSAYVHMTADLDKLKSLPSYLAIGRFSSPPQLSDLAGFELDADDVNDLKECKPENCAIQLPAENIEQVKSQIEWSAADPTGQVNELAKKMAWRLSSLTRKVATQPSAPTVTRRLLLK